MSQGNRVIHLSDVSKKDKTHEGLYHDTSTTPNTKRCEHTSFYKPLFHFLTFPAQRKHFGNDLHCWKMAQTLPWWALLIYLLLQMQSQNWPLPLPRVMRMLVEGERFLYFSTVQNSVCYRFLTWDFSIIGLILSVRKSVLFDEAPQEGINIIYPFPAH